MTTFAFTKEKTWQEKLIDQVLNTNKKSFRTSLKVYGELLVRKGNKWVKNTNPVPMQRLSKKRAETDVLKPYYFKKNPDTGRCMGYNSVAANRGNEIIITTKDIVDTFGNKVPAYSILQLNGNTNLVAQCLLLNGDVSIPTANLTVTAGNIGQHNSLWFDEDGIAYICTYDLNAQQIAVFRERTD